MKKLINKIKLAGKTHHMARGGSITAVVPVNWRFMVSVVMEKNDIDNLTEESLREMVGEQVDEMVRMTTHASNAIDFGDGVELRNPDTDEEIHIPENFAVIGRLPLDDANVRYVFAVPSEEAARIAFAWRIYRDRDLDEEARALRADMGDEDGLGVIIESITPTSDKPTHF